MSSEGPPKPEMSEELRAEINAFKKVLEEAIKNKKVDTHYRPEMDISADDFIQYFHDVEPDLAKRFDMHYRGKIVFAYLYT